MGRHRLHKPRVRFAATLSTTVVGTAALFGVLATTTTAGPALTASSQPDAKGNNGTIKIDDNDVDGPDNNPHVGCTFIVSFWGFDTGDDHATVEFDVQSPSGSGTYPNTQGSLDFHFTGSGSGSTLDHAETYTLDPTGFTAQQNQGFHAKVIATVSTSNGNDTKSKVFWFGPCAAPTPTPTPSPSPSISPTPSPSPSVSPSESPSPSVSPSASPSTSPTPSPSASPSPSLSPSTSPSPSDSPSPSPSSSPSPSQSPSPADPGTSSPAPSSPAATSPAVVNPTTPNTVVEATVVERIPPVTLPSPAPPVKVKAVKHQRQPQLAYTGANVLPIGGLALAMIGVGVIILRRRRDA